MRETWKVLLLGGFAVHPRPGSLVLARASQRLVAFLALRGPCSRSLVAGSLWPDASEEHALGSLRTAVWRVNRVLPGLLSCDEAGVGLSPSTEVDSREQEALARQLLETAEVDAVLLTGQLHCLRSGDLLPGWYDDWVVDERELLRQLRLHALERTARVLIRAGHLDLALTLAIEAVRAEPLRESANALLISVYVAEGNLVDAVRLYDHFRSDLWQEVGVDPSPAMVGLLPVRARVTLPLTRVQG